MPASSGAASQLQRIVRFCSSLNLGHPFQIPRGPLELLSNSLCKISGVLPKARKAFSADPEGCLISPSLLYVQINAIWKPHLINAEAADSRIPVSLFALLCPKQGKAETQNQIFSNKNMPARAASRQHKNREVHGTQTDDEAVFLKYEHKKVRANHHNVIHTNV